MGISLGGDIFGRYRDTIGICPGRRAAEAKDVSGRARRQLEHMVDDTSDHTLTCSPEQSIKGSGLMDNPLQSDGLDLS